MINAAASPAATAVLNQYTFASTAASEAMIIVQHAIAPPCGLVQRQARRRTEEPDPIPPTIVAPAEPAGGVTELVKDQVLLRSAIHPLMLDRKRYFLEWHDSIDDRFAPLGLAVVSEEHAGGRLEGMFVMDQRRRSGIGTEHAVLERLDNHHVFLDRREPVGRFIELKRAFELIISDAERIRR